MSKESLVLERSRLGNEKRQIGAPNLMNVRTDANYLHASLAPEKQFNFASCKWRFVVCCDNALALVISNKDAGCILSQAFSCTGLIVCPHPYFWSSIFLVTIVNKQCSSLPSLESIVNKHAKSGIPWPLLSAELRNIRSQPSKTPIVTNQKHPSCARCSFHLTDGAYFVIIMKNHYNCGWVSKNHHNTLGFLKTITSVLICNKKPPHPC